MRVVQLDDGQPFDSVHSGCPVIVEKFRTNALISHMDEHKSDG